MRKGQVTILNEAQQYELNDNIISILKREDLTLKQLNYILHYCYAQIYIFIIKTKMIFIMKFCELLKING